MAPAPIYDALRPSLWVTALMLVVAIASDTLAGVSAWGLAADYVAPTALVAMLIILVHGLAERLARPASARAGLLFDLLAPFRTRGALLLLPTLISPLFLAGFTAAKSAIYRLVGYSWDRYFTEADRLIFGGDPWIWTHALIGTQGTAILGGIYVAWGAVLVVVSTLVALRATPCYVSRYFCAMFLTWFLGGCAMAYAFSAAGPAFAHRFGMGDDFAPLIASLDHLLASNSPVRFTQYYLLMAVDADVAVKGGGISAMPSMHVAACALMAIAAWRSIWFWPACLFAAVIVIGSVHLGYHYAVDGIAALPVAMLSWQLAGYFCRRSASAAESATSGVALARAAGET